MYQREGTLTRISTSRRTLLPKDAPYDLGQSEKGASFKAAAPGDKPGPALMYSPIPHTDTCLKEDTPSQRLSAALGPHHQTLIGNVSVLMLLAQSQRSLVICLWESSIGMFFFTIGRCEGMSHAIVQRGWDGLVFLGVCFGLEFPIGKREKDSLPSSFRILFRQRRETV